MLTNGSKTKPPACNEFLIQHCNYLLLAFILAAPGTSWAAGAVENVEDPAIIGTWTRQDADDNGKPVTLYERLDAKRQYRFWVEGGDSCSAGRFQSHDGILSITKVDGTELEAEYSLRGADAMLQQTSNGPQYRWTRVNHPVPLPGDSDKGPSAGDAKDPQKCFEEGSRLYRIGNMDRALEWFLRAANMGHAPSQLQAGWHLEKGFGDLPDYKAAAEWYRKAADQGQAIAMKNLGQLYENGLGVPEDWVQAADWYRKGAEKGEAAAESAMSRAYQFGIGVPQNRTTSIEWSQRALDHGDQSADNWVRWLRDPTNNIGFRNEQEQNLVMADRLRTSGLLLGADPRGILFHNSGERIEWLRGLRGAVDADEAAMARQRAQAAAEHEAKVRRLMSEGYSRSEAEQKAR